jgi:two-component system sensor histidine kinase KdpD
MTRLESGAVRLKSEWHSVEELVGGALTRMERALGGWRVETAVAADLPLVPVDALLVERVLVNLLDNAAKHTPPGSTIRVSASSTGDAVQVEVADDGPGLPPGEQERIFEKFFRNPSARSAGFGLGLAICRAIVNAHGGRIWAEDVAHGASLRFTLPVKGIPPELRAPEAADDSPA